MKHAYNKDKARLIITFETLLILWNDKQKVTFHELK